MHAVSRYTENIVTDKEFESLSPRVQEHIRRLAASSAGQGMYAGFYTPASAPARFKRVGKFRVLTCRSVYSILRYTQANAQS